MGGDWVHAPRGPWLQWAELPLGSEWGFRASVPGNQVAVGLGVHVSEWHAVLGPQAPQLLCRMTPTPSPRPLWLGENQVDLTSGEDVLGGEPAGGLEMRCSAQQACYPLAVQTQPRGGR